MLTASCYSSQCCFTFFVLFLGALPNPSVVRIQCQLPCIAKHVLYSCLCTLKYRTLAHLSFTNTIQTLRILKALCQPAPGTAAATRPCSQITLGRLVIFVNKVQHTQTILLCAQEKHYSVQRYRLSNNGLCLMRSNYTLPFVLYEHQYIGCV